MPSYPCKNCDREYPDHIEFREHLVDGECPLPPWWDNDEPWIPGDEGSVPAHTRTRDRFDFGERVSLTKEHAATAQRRGYVLDNLDWLQKAAADRKYLGPHAEVVQKNRVPRTKSSPRQGLTAMTSPAGRGALASPPVADAQEGKKQQTKGRDVMTDRKRSPKNTDPYADLGVSTSSTPQDAVVVTATAGDISIDFVEKLLSRIHETHGDSVVIVNQGRFPNDKAVLDKARELGIATKTEMPEELRNRRRTGTSRLPDDVYDGMYDRMAQRIAGYASELHILEAVDLQGPQLTMQRAFESAGKLVKSWPQFDQ